MHFITFWCTHNWNETTSWLRSVLRHYVRVTKIPSTCLVTIKRAHSKIVWNLCIQWVRPQNNNFFLPWVRLTVYSSLHITVVTSFYDPLNIQHFFCIVYNLNIINSDVDCLDLLGDILLHTYAFIYDSGSNEGIVFLCYCLFFLLFSLYCNIILGSDRLDFVNNTVFLDIPLTLNLNKHRIFNL